MSFLKSIVKTAGKGIKGAAKGVKGVAKVTAKVTVHASGISAINKAGKKVGKVVKKVPIIGKPLSTVVNITTAPTRLTQSVLSGERIDKAALGSLKQSVRDVKEVAPYAQMVISCVPGIGTGVAAGLAAGLALAEGQPITAAIQAGVLGAIPGGPLAKSAANIAIAVAQKKPIDKIAIAALPLTPDQKKAVEIAVSSAKDLAAGKRVDKIILARAEGQLPREVRSALNIGLAIGHGQSLQKAIVKEVKPAALNLLKQNGIAVLKVNSVMRAGLTTLKTQPQKSGFQVGTAISRFAVKPVEVVAIRQKLTAPQKIGFDLALAAHAGAVQQAPPPAVKANPTAAFAFNATNGAQVTAPATQNTIVTVLASKPATQAGVQLAVTSTPSSTAASKGFWHRVMVILGLAKE